MSTEPMTRDQALVEARRRFGDNAAVMFNEEVFDFTVGVLVRDFRRGERFTVLGQGPSWKTALEDAERRLGPPLAKGGTPPGEPGMEDNLQEPT